MHVNFTNNFLCELPSAGEALHWFFFEEKDFSLESLWRAVSENPSYLVLYLIALAAVVGLALVSLRFILPRGKLAGARPWGAGEGLLVALLMFGLVYVLVPMMLAKFVISLLGIDDGEMMLHRVSAVVMPISIAGALVLLLGYYSKRHGQDGRSGVRGLGFCSKGIAANLARGFGLALLTIPLMLFVVNVSILVFSLFGVAPQEQMPVTGIRTETNAIYLALGCFSAIVGAAVWEETLFRGLFMQGLKRDIGRFAAILVSAGVFAAVHDSVTVMPPIFVMGIILGYIYEKTDSLWASIGFHATFNASQIALLLLARGVQ